MMKKNYQKQKRFELQFFENQNYSHVPLIRLTQSLNGETGTATFLFLNLEFLLNSSNLNDFPITCLCLFSEEEQIEIRNIQLFFQEGKPFLIKAILVLKNPIEWFEFLFFMKNYSLQIGLSFYEGKKMGEGKKRKIFDIL